MIAERALQTSVYHRTLRLLAVVTVCVLVMDSGLALPQTAALSDQAQQYLLAAVGVHVGVAPNDVNVLTARITELEQELGARDRVIPVSISQPESGSFNTSTFLLSLILFMQLVLIVLNYILDYTRGRSVKHASSSPVH